MHRRSSFAVVCLAFALWIAAPAFAAASHTYAGHHPLPNGQGFCYTAGSHTHAEAPDASVAHLYRASNGVYSFVGDPYHFGYSQRAWGFDGHHPIHAAFGGGWCYLDGPHHHFFHPHRDDVRQYTVFGGHYYYLGPVGADYGTMKAALYAATPPYATLPVYAPLYSARFGYASRYAAPASATYVVAAKLPRRHYVPGMYAGAYFGLPGLYAGFGVATPVAGVHVGVGLPAVGVGIGFGPPMVATGPVVVRDPYPTYYHPGKRKGWYKYKPYKHHRKWKKKRNRRYYW